MNIFRLNHNWSLFQPRSNKIEAKPLELYMLNVPWIIERLGFKRYQKALSSGLNIFWGVFREKVAVKSTLIKFARSKGDGKEMYFWLLSVIRLKKYLYDFLQGSKYPRFSTYETRGRKAKKFRSTVNILHINLFKYSCLS